MLRKLLISKIHRATITRCDPDYVGSITIDAELLARSGMRPNEAVWVLDIDNAVRFETYVIRGEPGGGAMEVNGAAAKLVEPGHKIIVLNYGLLTEPVLDEHEATIVLVDESNRPTRTLRYPSRLDEPAMVT